MVTTSIRGDRSKAGQVFINHKGHLIPTSVGSRPYENKYSGEIAASFIPKLFGNIPFGFEHRPELISNLFLGTPNLWWVICERNAIFDVFEQLKAGTAIKIPGDL
jgi:hypothetical protein